MHPGSLLLLAAAFYFLFAAPLLAEDDASHGTAIATIRTPEQIVVASDSREVGASGAAHDDTVCKIRTLGSAFVAVHGLNRDKKTGLNVFDAIGQASAVAGSIKDRAAWLESRLREPLTRALQRIRDKDAAEFRAMLSQTDPLGIIIFGFENSIAVMSYRRFVVRNPGNSQVVLDVERTDCPGPQCPNDRAVDIFVGIGADAFKRSRPGYLKMDLADVARDYVQSCIDSNRIDFGPPINVLKVSRYGVEWINRTGCQ